MSIICSDNEIGYHSWGYFNENKLLITSSIGTFPMRRLVWNRLKLMAYEIADELNEKERKNKC